MLLRLPVSVTEAQQYLAEGAVPVGGATLVWATWQRDGFPEQAMSLRHVPEANVLGPRSLGAAVVLERIDDRVPRVLRDAAASVGTGAVRRAATVGGNLVGSALRCLLPAALVLDARATVLEPDGVRETDLTEVLAKRHLLLGLHWREPLASAHCKQPGEAGGRPPLVVATAVHEEHEEREGHTTSRRLRVAVRDGYDVLTGSVPYSTGTADNTDNADGTGSTGTEQLLRTLRHSAFHTLSPAAWEEVRRQVTGVLASAG
ncbi:MULTISPECIES: FAD binding domain-containing protein [Streptomyces]|uniref:FAD binding domain-containing protein n=1 Tax=Streptomyces TaxID=1883 RepID=UPI000A398669|nr:MULTISPECIES: FAD binding domain-containing protein [Streptomyces]MDN5382081.1 FAD binding domain-containing protein [Streptomyces sp. LB8]